VTTPLRFKWVPATLFILSLLILSWLAAEKFLFSNAPGDNPAAAVSDAVKSVTRAFPSGDTAGTAAQNTNAAAHTAAPAAAVGLTPEDAAKAARAKQALHDWRDSGGSVEAYIQNFAARNPSNTQPSDKEVPVMEHKYKFRYVDKLRASLSQVRQDAFASDSDVAWAALQYEPEFQMNEVTGLRVNDYEADDFLKRHGLEQGDVIKSVNGVKIDGPDAANRALGVVAEAKHLELVVERGSQTLNLVVDKNHPQGGG